MDSEYASELFSYIDDKIALLKDETQDMVEPNLRGEQMFNQHDTVRIVNIHHFVKSAYVGATAHITEVRQGIFEKYFLLDIDGGKFCWYADELIPVDCVERQGDTDLILSILQGECND